LAHSGGGSIRPGSALDDWLRAEEQIREAEERAVDAACSLLGYVSLTQIIKVWLLRKRWI
jgi:hypothetical protein